MKRHILCLMIVVVSVFFAAIYLQPIVLAQPGFDEPWEPDVPPPEQLPSGEAIYLAGGPIQAGYGFVAYFEDRHGVRRTEAYEDEMVILVITLPPGLRNSWASCIQYYPPNYVIRNYLFRWINLGPSGTYRLGPFYQAPGEPYGRYAFRIGVLSVDQAGNRYWDQVVTFLEVRERTVTITLTQRETVTQTQVVTAVTTVTQTTEKTLTTERTLTQPTIITVEKPVLVTIEKTMTQTTTATTTVQAMEVSTIISIAAIVIVAVIGVYLLRITRKKTAT